MTPTTRSGKGLSRNEILAHKAALRAGPVNTKGFPALPVELLLEIVSHFPSVDIPCLIRRALPSKYLERNEMLRYLSQMCRSLRSVFLPYTWQKIEVCACQESVTGRRRRYLPVPWEKELATELIRQLEIVTIRDPTLAAYVKIVNVVLTSYSADTVLPEFARCLSLFPNLHTIQIAGVNNARLAEPIKQAFQAYRFSSVHTVVIPAIARGILVSCPETRRVTCTTDGHYDLQLFLSEGVTGNCPKAEILGGLGQVNHNGKLKMMVQSMPNLRTVNLTLSLTTPTGMLEEMQALTRLRKVETIVFKIEFSRLERSYPWVDRYIDSAKKILGGMPARDGVEKCVLARYNNGKEKFYVD